MSRSGYCDDFDGTEWDLIRWRGAVKSAIRGKRGQQMLREMATALDAMPEKELIEKALDDGHGGVCAMGCLGKARGVDMSKIDPEEPSEVAKAFGIAQAMAQEIAFVNDEYSYPATPKDRWEIVRKWVADALKEA